MADSIETKTEVLTDPTPTNILHVQSELTDLLNTIASDSTLSDTIPFDYSKTDLVVYHAPCPDGLGAGWVFWRDVLNRDSTKFFPGKFGETPPEVAGKNVVFVDFSYPIDVMTRLLDTAKSIRVLDHHKTTEPLTTIKNVRFSIVLDMTRSGAMIAWDEVHPGVQRPWFINDIGDRDLWTWSVPDSKHTTRAMFGMGKYNNFETLNTVQDDQQSRQVLRDIGIALNTDDERTYDALVKSAVDCLAYSADTKGRQYKVRLVECDHTKASDVGNRLVQDKLCDFAVMYRYNIVKDEWYLSCRSLKGQGIDLTQILKQFDRSSGGHPEAAGMTIYKGYSLKSYFFPKTTTFVQDDIAEKARIKAEAEATRLRLIAEAEAKRIREEKEEADRKMLKRINSMTEYS